MLLTTTSCRSTDCDYVVHLNVKETPFPFHNFIKQVAVPDSLSLCVHYHIHLPEQDVVLKTWFTSKGNISVVIPRSSGDAYERVYDRHDDGIVYDPPCAEIVFEDADRDGLVDLIITYNEAEVDDVGHIIGKSRKIKSYRAVSAHQFD